MQGSTRADDIAQTAIHPVTHDRMGFIRLQVYITGTVPHRLGEQGVDHADDRRIVLVFQQVGDSRQFLHQTIQVYLVGGRIHHAGGIVALCVTGINQGIQFRIMHLALVQLGVASPQFHQGPIRCAFANDQRTHTLLLRQHRTVLTCPGVRQAGHKVSRKSTVPDEPAACGKTMCPASGWNQVERSGKPVCTARI